LREKIERDPSHPASIETVRGGGYRLKEPDEVSGAPQERFREAKIQNGDI
jgi:DNA-binding winged helix-turn-helix (wHTH) protein